MKRFVSLKVQDDSLEDEDPYELTTWMPIGPDTPLSLISDHLNDKYFIQTFMTPSSGQSSLQQDYTKALSVHRKEIRPKSSNVEEDMVRRDFLYLESAIDKKEDHYSVTLRAPKVSFIHEKKPNMIGLLRVESPTFVGEKRPQLASAGPSAENMAYVPSQNLLNLKKARSNIFINEPEREQCHLPLTLDPRIIQKHIEEERNAKFIIHEDDFGNQFATLDKSKMPKPTTNKSTQIINDTKTIVQGTTCIECANNEPQKWTAIAVAMASYAYSKLVDPMFWNDTTIDDILQIGINFGKNWSFSDKDDMINNIPNKIDLKGFRVEVLVEPTVVTGDVSNLSNYVCSDLYRNINDLFSDARSKGVLVEFEEHAFVVWYKRNIFYFFDCYNRDELGNKINKEINVQTGSDQLENEKSQMAKEKRDTAEHNGSACLMITSQLKNICQTIYENIVQPFPMSFKLHIILTERVDRIMYEKEEIKPPNIDSALQKSTINNKTAAPIPKHDFVSTIPLNDLSVLSMPKRKKKPAPIKEHVEEEIIETPEILQNTEQKALVETNMNIVADNLDAVLDKIQDKIEKKCEKKTIDNRARKILIKSDLGCLQVLEKNLIRNTTINVCDSCERIEPYTKLDNSHFRRMPDQSEVMLGTKNLLQVVEYNESIGVVAPIIAVVLANKYQISSWEPTCLDFVLSTTLYVQECVPMNRYSMFQAQRHHLPDLQIGSDRFSITLNCVSTGILNDIGTLLSLNFEKYSRLVISSIICNVAVIKCGDIFYMFDAFPCDVVGIRSNKISEGVASLQRFLSVESLAIRIKCNASVARLDQHCSVNSVVVKNVTDSSGLVNAFRFVPLPANKENEFIEKLNDEEKERVERNKKMLRDLHNLIKEEKCRIKKFHKKAGFPIKRTQNKQDMLGKNEEKSEKRDDGGFTCDEGNKDTCIVAADPNDMVYDEILRQPYGFALVAPEQFLKIQGSSHLSNRFSFRANGIRACHFCSMYAASVVAVLGGKWDRWNFSLVDLCIEEGREIYSHLIYNSHMEKRVVDRVPINRKTYTIIIEAYHNRSQNENQSHYCSDDQEFSKQLYKFFKTNNRYVLVQFPNVTFALVRQNSYCLFDPYSSCDIFEGSKRLLMTKDPSIIEYPIYKDNCSSAWISVPTLSLLVKYIKQRIRPRDINVNCQLFTIKCIESTPIIGNSKHVHYMLKYSLRRDEPPMSLELASQYMRNEEVSWVSYYPKVFPWSRQHSKNSMDIIRYKPNSMWKSFDVEVEGLLYSLWANLHPMCAVFDPKYRGKQFAGIYAIAACIASIYQPEEWTTQLLNYIVVEGDKYFTKRMMRITKTDYEVKLEDIRGKTELASFAAKICVQQVIVGILYSKLGHSMNLKSALLFFFSEPDRRFGVLQCCGRSLAFGKTNKGNYFMFDCMCIGRPVFMPWEGAAYLLLTSSLNHLLFCIVLTLRLMCYNVEFHLHSICTDVKPLELSEYGEDEDE